jgi:hypothetical protein
MIICINVLKNAARLQFFVGNGKNSWLLAVGLWLLARNSRNSRCWLLAESGNSQLSSRGEEVASFKIRGSSCEKTAGTAGKKLRATSHELRENSRRSR